MRSRERNASVVALGCAVSAGVHAALVPEHLREAPQLGVAFVVATGLLLAAAIGVAIRPGDARAARAAQVLLVGLLAGYLASRTAGIPLLEPRREPADALGLATKAVELLALLFTLRLPQTAGGRRPPLNQEVAR